VKPQLPVEQVAELLAGALQAMHDVPHEVGAAFETQALPHACWFEGQLQTPPVPQVPPCGQSVESRHPTAHLRVTGSQK
jgi:hypothetical protein